MTSRESIGLFATAPFGVDKLLSRELRALGAAEIRPSRGGAAFRGTLELAYRVCLWSRTANRVLLPVARFSAASAEALYEGTRRMDWLAHLDASRTLAVEVTAKGPAAAHTQFATLKVKDAIVDQIREATGNRPSVDTESPDVRVNVHLDRDLATVSIDLAGESLHRRGYRASGVEAPLKENLAAALLLFAGWPDVAARGGTFLDPMCGSGTLPIEAALMAADIAPGLLRQRFGFSRWKGHAPEIWDRLRSEATERRERGLTRLPPIVGYDIDAEAVRIALGNVDKAGLSGRIHIERRALDQCEAPKESRTGLVVTNPPYGERLGEVAKLKTLYSRLGERLRQRLVGWNAWVLLANPELAVHLGATSAGRKRLFNGPIACELRRLEIPAAPTSATPDAQGTQPGAQMLANRLRKNLKTVGRWARQEGITCYRLYDADLPEYAVAIDLYEKWVHVQEYAPPAEIEPVKAESRLIDVLQVVSEVMGISRENIFLKTRRRQKGHAQYTKHAAQGILHEVHEGGLTFLVNFTDYLDTGLFLDERPVRQLIRELARGRRFLNLFSYTGTATVCAAAGGATDTVSVDRSNTYLAWAEKNFARNAMRGRRHELIRADCVSYLRDEQREFDLIYVAPPTFSSSKSAPDVFDIQRDHAELLWLAAARLAKDGVLLFSTNYRRFKLDEQALNGLRLEDISATTIPKDFARNPKIHKCWSIVRDR